MTAGQRWRRRRNLAILGARYCGASQRFIGDVFDLDASTVNRILAAFRRELGADGDREQLRREIRACQGRSDRVEKTLGVAVKRVTSDA